MALRHILLLWVAHAKAANNTTSAFAANDTTTVAPTTTPAPTSSRHHPEACQERCYPEEGQNYDEDCCALRDRMSCLGNYTLIQLGYVCASGDGWKAHAYECVPCEGPTCDNGPGDDADECESFVESLTSDDMEFDYLHVASEGFGDGVRDALVVEEGEGVRVTMVGASSRWADADNKTDAQASHALVTAHVKARSALATCTGFYITKVEACPNLQTTLGSAMGIWGFAFSAFAVAFDAFNGVLSAHHKLAKETAAGEDVRSRRISGGRGVSRRIR